MNNIAYILYTVCLFVSVAGFVFICLQEVSREQKISLLTTGVMAVICLGYWFEISSVSVFGVVTARKIQFLGECHFYFLMLLYFMLYCKRRLNRKLEFVLLGINFILMIYMFNFDNTEYIYKSYRLVFNNGVPTLQVSYAPGFYICSAVLGLYCLSMIIIAFMRIINSKKIEKLKMMCLLSTVLITCGSYFVNKVFNISFNVLPVGMVISECILVALFYISKVKDVNTIAREYVFDTLDDGIIILDANQCYKDANKVAMHLFPELMAIKYSKTLRHVSSYFKELLGEGSGSQHKIYKSGRCYQPAVRKVYYKKKITGYVIWFDDISEQEKHLEFSQNYQKNLEHEVDKKTIQVHQMQENMIFGFADIVENRDFVTGGHVKRTSAYVEAVVCELKKKNVFSTILTDEYLNQIRLAAPLHDIGKVAISDSILNKPGRLTKDEFEKMKTHTTIGGKVIDETIMFVEEPEYYTIAKDVAMYHHEKWNGQGYPEGLAGEQIPLSARIMAVADVFDALVTDRPYKDAYTLDTAFDIIEQESGKQFDPDIVNVFMEIRPQIEHIYNEFVAA